MVDNILSLLPHRPPFVMIDELLFADSVSSRTSYRVSPDNVFTENGKWSEAGLLENMAQTVAAGAGYMARSSNEAVKVGFIGAVKNFVVGDLPFVGDQLITEITITDTVFNMVRVEGVISCNGSPIASGELNIFIND
ncbi:MAG TPA: 3-hydroxyacyl-ACP dehydratase [Puia sp.]|jgi:predicted hotdog family 3-hydroxylacyl-ACP dehydratase